MKNNYYSLKSTRKTSRKKIHSINQKNYNKKKANYRKRKARKLNYRKFFIFLIAIFIIFYLIITGLIKLFSNKNTSTSSTGISSEVPKDITVNIAVIGDIMCHTTNFDDAYDSKTDSYDFSKVFTNIQSYIQNADIAIGNLETTFSGKDVGYTGYPTFNTPEQLAQNIADLGIDVVSTANNHSLDKKYAGLVSTLDELDKVRFKSHWYL